MPKATLLSVLQVSEELRKLADSYGTYGECAKAIDVSAPALSQDVSGRRPISKGSAEYLGVERVVMYRVRDNRTPYMIESERRYFQPSQEYKDAIREEGAADMGDGDYDPADFAGVKYAIVNNARRDGIRRRSLKAIMLGREAREKKGTKRRFMTLDQVERTKDMTTADRAAAFACLKKLLHPNARALPATRERAARAWEALTGKPATEIPPKAPQPERGPMLPQIRIGKIRVQKERLLEEMRLGAMCVTSEDQPMRLAAAEELVREGRAVIFSNDAERVTSGPVAPGQKRRVRRVLRIVADDGRI